MKELREMLELLRTALAEKGGSGGTAAAPPEDELRDLERQIARQKKVAQVCQLVIHLLVEMPRLLNVIAAATCKRISMRYELCTKQMQHGCPAGAGGKGWQL